VTGRIAAFFDVDKTLIEVNSGRKWLEYLWTTKQISWVGAARSMLWLLQYRLSVIDYEAMTRRVLLQYRGRKVEELESEIGAWVEQVIVKTITTQARERIAEHRAKGHEIVMLTSGTSFSTRPLARLLDIDHLLCTEVEARDGVLTGEYYPPPCYGSGKVHWAERFAEEHGIDLSESYFYTDSFSDLPMLERVGRPRIVNPDPRLKRASKARGWVWECWSAP
jgi:HAD superfamily hydrolase (TIGR01490 family)